MSQSELEKLEAEEREIRERLDSIRKLRQEIKTAELEKERAEALKKSITLRVVRLQGGSLLIEGDHREDVVEYLKTVPGRSWRGYTPEKLGKNLIPIAQWDKVEERLTQEFSGVTIEWEKGVKEEIEWYLTAPPWEVLVHPSRRHFLARMGPRVSAYRLLSHIPGADWDESSKSWKLPLSEGWRLFKSLEPVEGVVYSEDAKAIIFEQVKSRAELDIIAQKEDTDFTATLTRPIKIRGKDELVPFHEALKPFQRVGIEFGMKAGGRLLNGDDTGLGKTWQAVAMAELMRMKNENHQTVVMAKAANIPNWLIELKNLTGEEAIQCIGGKPDYFAIDEIVNKRAPYVIISYDTLGAGNLAEKPEIEEDIEDEYEWVEGKRIPKRKEPEVIFPWVTIFQTANPDMLILDEAHQIKTPEARRSKAARMLVSAPHVIPMTASPVLNRTEELWALLFMLDPEMFKVHDQFISTYTFNGRSPRNTKQLHELLRPMFIRRRKGDVIKDLPPINRITRYHKLSKKAEEDYELVLRGIYRLLEEYSPSGVGGDEISVLSILAQITRLKQICAADKLDFTAEIATELIDEHTNGESGKVLIFSQFKGTAHALRQRLGHEAVCTVNRTPGDFVSLNAQDRHDMFERARGDDRIKYIVTTEAAKEGHNLEFCNWVIFNDLLWTPAGHDQCEGRAYGRLSNPHPIDSFYIVADVDIEKWIMDLLDKKLAIISEAVEGVEGSREFDGSVGGDLIRKMKESMYTRSR